MHIFKESFAHAWLDFFVFLFFSFYFSFFFPGRSVVVNGAEGGADDINAVLERASLERVGQFVMIDMDNIRNKELEVLEDDSMDLVSLMQGLHHLKPDSISPLLKSIFRVLRPGAVFLVREHDMDDVSLRPILDCAHSVFNAVTGVTLAKEKQEIRGFRSVLEWRSIIEAEGFIDTKVCFCFDFFEKK